MLCSGTWFATADAAASPGLASPELLASETMGSWPARLLFIVLKGVKPIICGVQGVHLEEFPKAAHDDGVGIPSLPLSMTSSLNISTLRPRRCARAPATLPLGKGGFRCRVEESAATSSDDATSPEEDRGESVCVLAAELVQLFEACSRGPSNNPAGDSDDAASPEEEPGDVDRVLAAELLLLLVGRIILGMAVAGGAGVLSSGPTGTATACFGWAPSIAGY